MRRTLAQNNGGHDDDDGSDGSADDMPKDDDDADYGESYDLKEFTRDKLSLSSSSSSQH